MRLQLGARRSRSSRLRCARTSASCSSPARATSCAARCSRSSSACTASSATRRGWRRSSSNWPAPAARWTTSPQRPAGAACSRRAGARRPRRAGRVLRAGLAHPGRGLRRDAACLEPGLGGVAARRRAPLAAPVGVTPLPRPRRPHAPASPPRSASPTRGVARACASALAPRVRVTPRRSAPSGGVRLRRPAADRPGVREPHRQRGRARGGGSRPGPRRAGDRRPDRGRRRRPGAAGERAAITAHARARRGRRGHGLAIAAAIAAAPRRPPLRRALDAARGSCSSCPPRHAAGGGMTRRGGVCPNAASKATAGTPPRRARA